MPPDAQDPAVEPAAAPPAAVPPAAAPSAAAPPVPPAAAPPAAAAPGEVGAPPIPPADGAGDERAAYDRFAASLVGRWAAFATRAPCASIEPVGEAMAAIFPASPTRALFNNALLARDAADPDATLLALRHAYARAGVARFGLWLRADDRAALEACAAHGWRTAATTVAMLAQLPAPAADTARGSGTEAVGSARVDAADRDAARAAASAGADVAGRDAARAAASAGADVAGRDAARAAASAGADVAGRDAARAAASAGADVAGRDAARAAASAGADVAGRDAARAACSGGVEAVVETAEICVLNEVEADLLPAWPERARAYLVRDDAGRALSAAVSTRHGDDCALSFVATLPKARRQGHAGRVVARLLADAAAAGCTTATLSSTAVAERLYRALGFRDLCRMVAVQPL
ncbi:GNAT family N-acetyltransferase [Conexibacter sp. CPCC 205706]|uniref:GNAT family N-acetyltransferase n=1 Tax=Conexibacter sp. CPCC 205706 TaxID=3064572 RepID=UPI00271FD075|nr:GNAT family N-acetyltransferase [Conexibacter sp. CPCC 205706]MDO8187173.1 GNAT family N-acetyltransferase [Conexibacter sp. CPCC 205706]